MIDKTISWDDYCKIERMNPSTLVAGCKSPRALRRAMREGFKEPTDAMRLGTGIHALFLEPEKFESMFVVMPAFHLDPENVTGKGEKSESKSTTYYKQKVAEFNAKNDCRFAIERYQYDTALTCIEALNDRKHFRELLQSSNCEVTVIGEIEGVPCKGRVDILHSSCICDLKTTYDVAEFGRTSWKLNYLFKLAMYRELVRQNTCEREVKVIAQETKGDFDNAMFSIPKDVLDVAYSRVLFVINQYKQCLETDVWPGWDGGQDEVEIEIPYFARKQMEEIDWSGVELNAEEPTEAYF